MENTAALSPNETLTVPPHSAHWWQIHVRHGTQNTLSLSWCWSHLQETNEAKNMEKKILLSLKTVWLQNLQIANSSLSWVSETASLAYGWFLRYETYLSLFSSSVAADGGFNCSVSNCCVTSSAHLQLTSSCKCSEARQCGHCDRCSVNHLCRKVATTLLT